MRPAPPDLGPWAAFLGQEGISYDPSLSSGVVSPGALDAIWTHLLTGVSWAEAGVTPLNIL